MHRPVPVLAAALALAACRGPQSAHPAAAPASTPQPGDRLERRGDEIAVCGQLFHTGTRVVLWNDPGGYDAYRLEPRFSDAAREETAGARYGTWRRNLPSGVADRVRKRGWTLADLQEVVHLFVLHFDAAGTSRRCFEILHDERHLSVHFMLDLDGTIYQTLDLKERAWHATVANDHGIGIEIAHPGSFPQPGSAVMARWYETDAASGRTRMKLPAFLGDPGQRTPGFVPRPDRDGIFEGDINGQRVFQRDFTPEQYRALARLTAALHRVFPRIQLERPSASGGAVLDRALEADALQSFDGVLGHFHVQTNKVDPGPAFQWDRLLRDSRSLVR